MPQWTVYSRADCSLCDQLLAELAALLGPQAAAEVRVIDIGQHPALQRKYGGRIPVLMADDEFVCAYRVDADRVKALATSD